jgi:hypothetical protein
MTLLEQLVAQQVRISTATTVNRATEKIAEQMANEIVKSPEFKAVLAELTSKAFWQTMRTLKKPATPTRRRRRKTS